VIVTEWEQFPRARSAATLGEIRRQNVVDWRNIYRADELKRLRLSSMDRVARPRINADRRSTDRHPDTTSVRCRGTASVCREEHAAVLVAPPGAGKTTRVPLVLREEAGRRRKDLRARAAAARRARGGRAHGATLGEQVGDTVGLRVRFGSRCRADPHRGVTEGIFTRLILDDPARRRRAVLFDEFHERSLDADLGLRWRADAQQGLREDLKMLVDVGDARRRAGGKLWRARGDRKQGRAFPVETRYLPARSRAPIERQVPTPMRRAGAQADRSWCFCRGGEIRRTETCCANASSDPAVDIVALYRALEPRSRTARSRRAAGRARSCWRPRSRRRSHHRRRARRDRLRLARVPRYEPDVGLTRLETVRVSRAAADQRARPRRPHEPGFATGSGTSRRPLRSSLTRSRKSWRPTSRGFVLDLAQWGVDRSANWPFLDPPPQARGLRRGACCELGAHRLPTAASPTRAASLRALPLPPRLARMIVDAAREGAGASPPRSPRSLTERGWAATTSISATGSTSSGARALRARRGCAPHGEALGRGRRRR
jgi:ATP-dependent helicase HrpB